jgi:hypothetical protein
VIEKVGGSVKIREARTILRDFHDNASPPATTGFQLATYSKTILAMYWRPGREEINEY